MATEENSGSVIAAMKKKPMKVRVKAKTSVTKSDNPPYVKMVTNAITALKERKGSSRQAILKYVSSKYKVDVAVAQRQLNRTLKKMTEKGELVAGAKPGLNGAGCYKLSPETKKALMKEEKIARKKGLMKDAGGKKSVAGNTVTKRSAKGNMAKKSAKGKKIIAVKAKVTKTVKGKKGDKKKISGGKTAAAKPKKKAATKIAKGKKGDKKKISGGKSAAKPKKVAKKGIKKSKK